MSIAPWCERSAGVLLHLTSLPEGRLDDGALRCADRLSDAGFRVWQILPIGPSAAPRNPFASASGFAGDPALVSEQAEVDAASCERFREENADWLEDWSLFAALKQAHDGAPWWEWPEALRRRDAAALAAARRSLADEQERSRLAQCRFESAWDALRRRLRSRAMLLFGDVPLFVARDSADVWAHRELFDADEDGRLGSVVGVPPDAFAASGQLWGLPPYRWDAMAASGYAWWKRRFEVQARRHDLLRLDHFRAFAAWWRVPAAAATAAEGAWVAGPGRAPIDALEPVLGGARLVAEDLGVITDDVVALRRALGLPGMRVLQFAFDGHPDNPHLPRHHGPDSVCYTGTHDNDTTLGWWRALPPEQREVVARELGEAAPRMPRALVELAWSSPAPLAIVPMQDLLGLDADARMNRPGVADGNWAWTLGRDGLPREFVADARRALERHDRIP
jgi:4-alpha-glucanotransferase